MLNKIPRFNVWQKKFPYRELNILVDRINLLSNINTAGGISSSVGPVGVNLWGGGGGSANIEWTTIAKDIEKQDLYYEIQSGAAADEWSTYAIGYAFIEGFVVSHNDTQWAALRNHEKGVNNAPAEGSLYWEESTTARAYGIGIVGPLGTCIPQFRKEESVPIVSYAGRTYILQTFIQGGYITEVYDEELGRYLWEYGSLMLDMNDDRGAAVYR